MFRRRHVLLPVLALTAAIAVPLSGCGSDDLDPSAAVAHAADKTAAVEGMHMTMTSDVAGETFSGEGFVDPVKKQGHVTTDVPGAGRMDVVTDGLTMYMKFPAAMTQDKLPDGKTWVKIDMQKALEGGGIDLSAFMNAGSTDPSAQLQQLKAMGDIEQVGTEDVDGVQTTHYKGVVDLRKAANLVPADQRDQARRSADKLVELAGGTSTIPTQLWIDDQGHIRKLKQTTPNATTGDVTSTIEYSDFGATEAIDIPSDDETLDITDQTADALS
jgi:hypothetical protein